MVSWRRRAVRIHPPRWWERFWEWVRGRDQLVVHPPESLPLLLITYPRGSHEVARELESVYRNVLPHLPASLMERYREVLRALPAVMVLTLRRRNLCGCLGHCHPRGAESSLARRLASELGGRERVAEVDLAYEAIQEWRPKPLAALAAQQADPTVARLHFRAALLAVLLHELEHVAFPERGEGIVRQASDELYSEVMAELVRRGGGHGFRMSDVEELPSRE